MATPVNPIHNQQYCNLADLLIRHTTVIYLFSNYWFVELIIETDKTTQQIYPPKNKIKIIIEIKLIQMSHKAEKLWTNIDIDIKYEINKTLI